MIDRGVRAWHERDQYWEAVADEVFLGRRAHAGSDVDCALALVRPEPGAQVLDMGCGVGLHSLELARRGYRVTGVDRTRSFVQQARLDAQAAGLAIEFVCADMRDFVRPEAFAAAFSLFTSFGYFEDPREDRIVADNLCRSLCPGGSILIDTDGREVFERRFVPRVRHEELDPVVIEERELNDDHHWVRAESLSAPGSRRCATHTASTPRASSPHCSTRRVSPPSERSARSMGGPTTRGHGGS